MMGNILQRFSAHESDVPTPSIVALTPAEVKIVKASWKIPSANPIDSAEFIFYSFLEQYPEHQEKFVTMKDMPLESLKGTPAFRAHAAKIFNIFTTVIDALDKDDKEMKGIKRILVEVGKTHAKRRISKQAQNDLRSVVVQIVSDVCKIDDEGKIAWSKLLDVFFHVMFECLDGRSEQFF